MKILTKYDALIVLTIFVLAILSYALIGLAASEDRAEIAEITVDGNIYASYKLNELQTAKIVNIKTQFGSNTVKITNDGAEMTESSCKDKLDVKCGKITKPGQTIICIPNRVTVRLKGKGLQTVDKVTY